MAKPYSARGGRGAGVLNEDLAGPARSASRARPRTSQRSALRRWRRTKPEGVKQLTRRNLWRRYSAAVLNRRCDHVRDRRYVHAIAGRGSRDHARRGKAASTQHRPAVRRHRQQRRQSSTGPTSGGCIRRSISAATTRSPSTTTASGPRGSARCSCSAARSAGACRATCAISTSSCVGTTVPATTSTSSDFSRGAFTARTLAGLICKCGILDPTKKVPRFRLLPPGYEDIGLNTNDGLKAGVRFAYQSYRRSYNDAPFAKLYRRLRDLLLRAVPMPEDFRREHALEQRPDEPLIEFIGVWDTVDAVGLPVDELSTMVDRLFYPHRFQNQNLSRHVRRACHAIAVDDERYTFHPVLWNEDGTRDSGAHRAGLVCGHAFRRRRRLPRRRSRPRLALLDDGESPLPPRTCAKGCASTSIVCGRSSSAPSRSARCTIPAAASACTTATARGTSRACATTRPTRSRSQSPRSTTPSSSASPTTPAGYAPPGLPTSYRVVRRRTGRSRNPTRTPLRRRSGRARRAELLERARDHVFWRRILYYALRVRDAGAPAHAVVSAADPGRGPRRPGGGRAGQGIWLGAGAAARCAELLGQLLDRDLGPVAVLVRVPRDRLRGAALAQSCHRGKHSGA